MLQLPACGSCLIHARTLGRDPASVLCTYQIPPSQSRRRTVPLPLLPPLSTSSGVVDAAGRTLRKTNARRGDRYISEATLDSRGTSCYEETRTQSLRAPVNEARGITDIQRPVDPVPSYSVIGKCAFRPRLDTTYLMSTHLENAKVPSHPLQLEQLPSPEASPKLFPQRFSPSTVPLARAERLPVPGPSQIPYLTPATQPSLCGEQVYLPYSPYPSPPATADSQLFGFDCPSEGFCLDQGSRSTFAPMYYDWSYAPGLQLYTQPDYVLPPQQALGEDVGWAGAVW